MFIGVKTVHLPEISRQSELGALGVRIVETIVHENLGLLFRAKERFDLGIDGEIEIVVKDREGKRRGTGRLIAVQIKCGESFFREEKDESFVFRGEMKHLDYWINSSIPVIVVICHPDTREAYWAEINPGLIDVTESGWKMNISKSSVLKTSNGILHTVAGRSYLRNVIDLAAQAWFHAKHPQKVDFCGIVALPRDYSGADHLISIGDKQFQLQLIIAQYGKFEIDDLKEVIRRYPDNTMYSQGIILALIAEHPSAFNLSDELKLIIATAPSISIVKLLFNKYTCEIGELNEEGEVEFEYHEGDSLWDMPWEEFMGSRHGPHYIRKIQ